MTHSNQKVGFTKNIAKTAGVVAVLIAGTTSGSISAAGASDTHTTLRTGPTPSFVTKHIAKHFPGATVAPGRYNREDAKAFIKGQKIAPTQVVADFNGDKRGDWAGLVRDRTGKIQLMVVYSSSNGYRHEILQSNVGQTGHSLRVSVNLQRPAHVKETPLVDKPKAVTLKRPGIAFVYFERSSLVFYWTGAKFAKLWTSD